MEFGICVPHYGKPVDTGRILDIARRTGVERALRKPWRLL